MFVFGAFADLSKARMVAILLASLGVPARRLNVAVRNRADPNVGPRGRDGKHLDAMEDISFRQLSPVGTSVSETLSGFSALYAWSGVGDVAQARQFCCALRIDDCRHIA